MATAEATQTYYVTKLAGRKVAGKRVSPGETMQLTERQARAELLAGALTADKGKVDDPFDEAAAQKLAADKAAAEKAAAEAAAAQAKLSQDQGGAGARTTPPGTDGPDTKAS